MPSTIVAMINRVEIKKSEFLIRLIACVVMLFAANELSAQISADLRFGGNLSHLDGRSFRSAKKVGLQAGLALQYNFTKNVAVQAEPSFSIARVRANEQTQTMDAGIEKGTKSLHYFTMPLFFKLCITSKFALLAGPEWSKLLNESKYELNNGGNAFQHRTRLGYSVGLELGSIYFRYREIKRVSYVHADRHAAIAQYQLGFKWDLF